MRSDTFRVVILSSAVALAAFAPGPRPGWEGLGPIPKFTWIEAGQPRPTPHIAETAFGLAPPPVLGSGVDPKTGQKWVSEGDPPSDCYNQPDGAACLRRNWLELLHRFGETELAAPSGGRSYRAFTFPSFTRAAAVRLDIAPDGRGVLTSSWAPANWNAPVTPPVVKTAPVTRSEVEALERAVALSPFERIIADPSALEASGQVCVDGTSWVFEAVVGGRYRYVARHSCDLDEDEARKLTEALTDLARAKTPAPKAPRPGSRAR
jgi:hypothetical protein